MKHHLGDALGNEAREDGDPGRVGEGERPFTKFQGQHHAWHLHKSGRGGWMGGCAQELTEVTVDEMPGEVIFQSFF